MPIPAAGIGFQGRKELSGSGEAPDVLSETELDDIWMQRDEAMAAICFQRSVVGRSIVGHTKKIQVPDALLREADFVGLHLSDLFSPCSGIAEQEREPRPSLPEGCARW